jgi:hypothetical protein
MSEQWPHFGTEEPSVASDELGSSSTNGAEPDDATGGLDDAVADATAVQDEPAGEAPATGEITSDASSSEGAPEEAAVAVATEEADATPVDTAEIDDGATFLTDLTRAMQTTVALERVRTGEETDRRRQAHVDAVRAREGTQADRIRELATDDMKAIDAWAEGETTRIQAERDRRAAELNKDLDTSLSEHHAKIDQEIQGIETAITAYRAEVATFFEGLDRETDPVLIAQQAARRPVFPNLEAADEAAASVEAVAADEAPAVADEAVAVVEPASASASSDASDGVTVVASEGQDEPALIGVMDPAPERVQEPMSIESLAPLHDPAPEPDEHPEPVAAATGSSKGSAEPLLQTVPSHRPMSWLRRDSNGGDRSNNDA